MTDVSHTADFFPDGTNRTSKALKKVTLRPYFSTMAKDIHDPAAVTAYLQNLEPAQGAVAEAIRQVFLKAHPSIGEQIKWNAPSFFYTGVMPAFDAKTYQRDLAVMHLRKGPVMLVFPMEPSLMILRVFWRASTPMAGVC